MEFAAGGDMFQHVTNKRGLSEDEARWFFQQLILGLDYCHKMVSLLTGPACGAFYEQSSQYGAAGSYPSGCGSECD